jgi:hypothetical protein
MLSILRSYSIKMETKWIFFYPRQILIVRCGGL